MTLDAYGQALTPCSTDAACPYAGCKDEGGVPYPAACVAGHCQHGDGGGAGTPLLNPHACAEPPAGWSAPAGSIPVRARPRRSRARSVLQRKSILCGAFAWVRRALNSANRRFPIRADAKPRPARRRRRRQDRCSQFEGARALRGAPGRSAPAKIPNRNMIMGENRHNRSIVARAPRPAVRRWSSATRVAL